MTEHKTTFVLVDINPAMTTEWQQVFSQIPNIEIVTGDFRELKDYDCIVSPGNSFGLMDGGFDLYLSHHFGWELMRAVQLQIRSVWHGQQPVGTCLMVPFKKMWLAHLPTMRLPTNIAGTDNVYRAFWALLVAVNSHQPPLKRVVCPGLGTGIGGMEPVEAAQQMALAWKHLWTPPPPTTIGGPLETVDLVGEDGTVSKKPRSGSYLITWAEAVTVSEEIDQLLTGDSRVKKLSSANGHPDN